MSKNRETFASRLGFILVSAGCAVGLGNVWKFPYVCGNNGGAIFILICIYWVVVVVSMLAALLQPGSVDGDASALSVLLYIAYGIIIAILFVIFIRIFSSTSKGESPFSMKQVKRLRMISCLLLLYAVLDSAITLNTAAMQLETFNSGYISTNESTVLTLNFAPFVAAAVVYAFSFVFKYGVLLQEFSDETL